MLILVLVPKKLHQISVLICLALQMKWKQGFLLRSGHARGADLAFESGVTNPRNMEIYLPWQKFNHAPVGEGYISLMILRSIFSMKLLKYF